MMFSREVRTLALAIGATLVGSPLSIRAQSQQALAQSVAVPTPHFEVDSIKLCKKGASRQEWRENIVSRKIGG